LVDLLDVDLGFGSNGSNGTGNLELLGAVGGVLPTTQQDPWNIQQQNTNVGWNTNAMPPAGKLF